MRHLKMSPLDVIYSSNSAELFSRAQYTLYESDTVEEYDTNAKLEISCVLGVLAAIVKAQSRKYAQFVICHIASEIILTCK